MAAGRSDALLIRSGHVANAGGCSQQRRAALCYRRAHRRAFWPSVNATLPTRIEGALAEPIPDQRLTAIPLPKSPQSWRRRLIEILTGLVSLSLVTFPLWGSAFFPRFTVWAILLFSLYWFHNSLRFTAQALIGYRKMRLAERRDWLAAAQAQPGFDRLWHLIIIPTYKEPAEVLAATLDHLVAQDFPHERMAVVLAFEVRDSGAPERWQVLSARYARHFAHFWCTFHPDIAGEVKGKSSNEAWGARQATARLREASGVALADVIITSADADSRFHSKYLSAVAYHFLTDPDRHYRIYQPPILFYSNLWRLPLPHRAYTAIQSVGHLARLVRTSRLVNQSTYSLSLLACHTIGYWDTDVIPEDSHMFFKMFFHLGERVRVVPVYLPVWADAAEGVNFWHSFRSLYEQEKRWSWGASDVPYVLEGFFRARHIPFFKRARRCWLYVEEHLFWPSNWFLLALGPRLPEWFTSNHLWPVLKPIATASFFFLNLCVIYMLIAAGLHLLMAASAPNQTRRTLLWTLVGWLFMPVSTFFFLALPATESHFRLLLGRRLEYKVTEKLPPGPVATSESSA